MLTNEEAIRYLKAIKEDGFGICEEEKEAAIDMAIDALKRPKGHWEFKIIGVSTFAIVCSECGNVLHKGQNYNNLDSFKQHIQSLLDDKGISIDKFCNECGADMREGDAE